MLNVLEHIKDEQKALAQVHRVLRPSGVLIIEVPAGPHLFDYYDEYLRHYRRYTLTHLTEVCARAGLEHLHTSHIGFWLYPAFWLAKKLNRRDRPKNAEEMDRRVKEQITKSGSSILLGAAMSFERIVARVFHVRYPVGIRCTGVFRKPN